MEYPPSTWVVLAGEDFDLAVPRDPGFLGVELMAQVRANGRIQDHYRLAVGGSCLLENRLPVSTLFSKALPAQWRLRYARWPRDLAIRQNMATSAWQDVRELVATGEATVEGEDGADVANEEFFNQLDSTTSKQKEKVSAALRWAVAIGDDKRIVLLLQALPAAASTILGKPTLRG